MPGPALVLGLTGSIGCGKSTVTAMLAERGADIIDADQEYRRLIELPGPLVDDIILAFGDGVQAADGAIDRRRLGLIVFADPCALRHLEEISHPAVARQIVARLRSTVTPVVVIEAIKLIEAGWRRYCDQIWVVSCLPAQQLQRLTSGRGMTPAAIQSRVKNQMSSAEMVQHADIVIDNSGDLESLRVQVDAAYNRLLNTKPRRDDP